MDEDSTGEKNDNFSFNHDAKTLRVNNVVHKESIPSSLSGSLKQQFTDGSMDVQYKSERQYFPATSLHMKLNSRYISKILVLSSLREDLRGCVSFNKVPNEQIKSQNKQQHLLLGVYQKISVSPRKLQEQSIRMRPYFIPERSRTKSESTDTKHDDINSYEVHSGKEDLITSQCDTMMDTSCDYICSLNTNGSTTTPAVVKILKNCITKKSKSLEDIRAKVIDGSQPSHEMEFVSNRIQKLKVQD